MRHYTNIVQEYADNKTVFGMKLDINLFARHDHDIYLSIEAKCITEELRAFCRLVEERDDELTTLTKIDTNYLFLRVSTDFHISTLCMILVEMHNWITDGGMKDDDTIIKFMMVTLELAEVMEAVRVASVIEGLEMSRNDGYKNKMSWILPTIFPKEINADYKITISHQYLVSTILKDIVVVAEKNARRKI